MKEKVQKYIVRSDRAGVFYGEIESEKPLGDKKEMKLRNVIRLWYWEGAASLSELAVHGTSKPCSCKFAVPVDSLEVMGVIEKIPVSKEAAKSIEDVSAWRA